jgi:hypothetical protein
MLYAHLQRVSVHPEEKQQTNLRTTVNALHLLHSPHSSQTTAPNPAQTMELSPPAPAVRFVPSIRTFLSLGSPAGLNLNMVNTFHIAHSQAPCSRHLPLAPPRNSQNTHRTGSRICRQCATRCTAAVPSARATNQFRHRVLRGCFSGDGLLNGARCRK